MTFVFPRALLREKTHSWNLTGTAMLPGQNAQNVAQIVRSDGGGFWTAILADVSLSGLTHEPQLRDRERQRRATLLWRAVRQVADGGVVPMVLWRNDALFRPWPPGVAEPVPTPGIPHSDGTLHSDGTGYAQSAIDAVTDPDTAYPLRATTMRIEMRVGATLVGGESFSILHPGMGWRLYEIGTVDYLDDGVTADITFMPPLREAIPASTQLEFDRPRCLMRLGGPNSMDLSVAPWTFNVASVDFVEAFT